MSGSKRRAKTRIPAAFTLLELLVASTIFAVLAGALYGIFSSALRLREGACAVIERELPATAALHLIRRDLSGMVIPAGTLAGPMLGTSDQKNAASEDQLEFYTTSGTIDEHSQAPWGDIQKVNYSLASFQTSDGGRDLELVRDVTRNLLASSPPEPEQQRLLGGVQSLKFQYLDSQTWVDSWDSTAKDNHAPTAVKMRIEFALGKDGGPQPEPLELVCTVDTGTTSTGATITTSTPSGTSGTSGAGGS